jgi:OOP family OmpA-OmpF porin
MYLTEYESTPGSHLAEPPRPAPAAVCRLLETVDGFEVGDYRLKPAHYERLMRIARLMAGFSRMRLFLRIEGHTDRSGPDRMNEGLSLNRASEVQSFLTRTGGPSRIDVVGVGEIRPTASNDTAEGRRRNRRVEIRLCQ